MVFFFILGEISFGKLSIINLIVGEKIFLIGIIVLMLRVCRIRYLEYMMILICNKNEMEFKYMIFIERNKMVEILLDFV